MSISPEDRLWNQLFSRLDRIESKLDDKMSRGEFKEAKEELDERIDELERELEEIKKAAVSPNQVVSLIGDKLKDNDARLISNRDRLIRWSVAGASMATFSLLLYDRIHNG